MPRSITFSHLNDIRHLWCHHRLIASLFTSNAFTGITSDMGYRVAGLLINYKQMREMASFLAKTEVTSNDVAYSLCSREAEKVRSRWVPVDYPEDSQRPRIVLALVEHDGDKKISTKKWNESHRAQTARKWLKDRNVSGTEEMIFVSVDDPFKN
ncbi:hypothetical protein BDZ97DRAFT_1923409 [Flammula alnicola]|nr:hypothetical protein BDZ97DRAFT_1923409 [Flammula alnicola]